MDRIDSAKAAAIGLGAVALAGCERFITTALPENFEPGSAPEESRFLARAGFGARPGEAEALKVQGQQAWIDSQLKGDAEEPNTLQSRLFKLDVLRLDTSDLFDLPEGEVMRQLQTAAILRAVYSPNQLRERMVDFWVNHFNIYAPKEDGTFFLARDQETVVRKHALGSFPEMVKASAHSPAMLRYLDNAGNKKGQPNENYARELMELHTLGVDGGYTQKDVQEVARCLTGWTVENRFMRPRGKFRFDSNLHDTGEKHVLGHVIPANGGEQDGERVLEIVAMHPSTARHLARKLCRYFGLTETASRIENLTRTYLDNQGQIAPVVRLVVEDAEFTAPESRVVKRPFDLIVSAIRQFGGDTDGRKPLIQHLDAMRQPLLNWPMPDGFPVDTEAWETTLLARWNFALALSEDRIGGTSIPKRELEKKGKDQVATLAAKLALNRTEEQGFSFTKNIALCVASPDFQWR
ncbi:MAG: DUF1800 domain-containing protein [Armatimonadetes bacterium]|nr:DUF1800 domain-containing protein [Armatimonadota bacterium]